MTAPATTHRLELVCPAGTPAGLRAAVDAGAHTVYCGFRDETNARNFPGLNFDRKELRQGIAYAHGRGSKVLVALNTFMRAGATDLWKRGVDDAVAAGADALILADLALIAYARDAYPAQRLHLSVQAAAATPEAIAFYRDRFNIARVVLPRVLTLEEIARLTAAAAPCETEVFVFGGMCVMAEGRCLLSSYVTGKSPNMNGVCSPASHVAYREENGALVAALGGFTIERFAAGEPAGISDPVQGALQGQRHHRSPVRGSGEPRRHGAVAEARPEPAWSASRSRAASAAAPMSPPWSVPSGAPSTHLRGAMSRTPAHCAPSPRASASPPAPTGRRGDEGVAMNDLAMKAWR